MTNLRRFDLNLFTVFEAIYLERNLTRAADRIAMSQPAASNALSRLRGALNDELFVRQGNSMQPTPKARELAKFVSQALDLIRCGVADAEGFDPTQPRTFNLAGIEHLEHYLLARLLESNKALLGSLHFNFTGGLASEWRDELKSGAIDLALDHVPLADDEYQVEQIGEDSLVSVVRTGHPAAGKTLDLTETLAQWYVVLQPRDERGFATERFLRSHSAADRIAVRVNHFNAMLSAVEKSDLVGTVPAQILEHLGVRFDIARVETAMTARVFRLLMIWHRSQTHDPANVWLRSQVSRLFS